MKLYLDDTRKAPQGWIQATTVEAALDILRSRPVREISLDDDLGEHVAPGRSLLSWMDHEGIWPTRRVTVHTSGLRAATQMAGQVEATGVFVPEPGCPRAYVRLHDEFEALAEARVYVEHEAAVETLEVGSTGRREGDRYIVWAHQPLGLPSEPVLDSRAHENLVSWARTEGLTYANATVVSAGQPFPSLALAGLTTDEARAIGRRWGQRAVIAATPFGVTLRDCFPVREAPGVWRLDFRQLCGSTESARTAANLWTAMREEAGNPLAAMFELEDSARLVDRDWLVRLACLRDRRIEAIW